VTSSFWSSSASRLAATTPALSRPAEKIEPSSSHPRFGVTSFQLASGPGDVLSRPRDATMPTPTSGANPTANAYGPADEIPIAASTTHKMMRTTPSEPITKAYAWNRPVPEQTPRARCAGA
jgi:hypothetical protein